MKGVDQALPDFIGVFEELELRYAVMGDIAVRAHSIPRPAWDVDITLGIDRNDLPRLFAAVEARGYTVSEAYTRGWIDKIADMPLVKFRIYLEGGGIDTDVLLAEDKFQRELLRRSKLQ